MAAHNFHFLRIGGSGLANCLFVYARAILKAKKSGNPIITPTWFNLSIGTYLRKQSDKRHYIGLFSSKGEISGFSKFNIIFLQRKSCEMITGLDGYFSPILEDSSYISSYIIGHIQEKHKILVDKFDFTNAVAVHVRLGDYIQKCRTPLEWYRDRIQEKKNEGYDKFLLLSDGTEEELNLLLTIPGVERVFFGSAISDIYAISKCSYLLGSDSTFSGWGAYLGQVPCRFYRKHYGPVLKDSSKEIVDSSENVW